MDLKQLRYFLNVARLGSYTQAAELLNVAQPVLSRQIRLLEIELRQTLFNRHGRGVTLTDTGAILLKHSQAILNQVDLLHEDIRTSERLSGSVAIAMPPTLTKLMALPLLRFLQQKLPDAQFSISEGLTTHLQHRLQMGKVDVALLHNPTYSEHMETRLLYREKLALIVPQDSPFAERERIMPDELANVPLIIPSAPNTFRLLIEQAMLHLNLQSQIALEIDSVEVILQLVAEGFGCTILSPHAVNLLHHRDKVRAIEIDSDEFICALFLATPNKKVQTRTQKQAVQWVQNFCMAWYDQ